MRNELRNLIQSISEETAKEQKRTSSWYLSDKTVKEFRAVCGEKKASKVLEKLMILYIESQKEAA